MFIILDLETTGLDSFSDEILEVSLLKIDSKTFEVLDSFSTIINPGVGISELISSFTGIINEEVLDKPYIDEIKNKILDFVQDFPILGYNLEFFLKFLKNNNINFFGNTLIDLMYLSNFLLKDLKSLSLESLGFYFDIDIKGIHRAKNDVYIILEIFKKLVDNIKNLEEIELGIIKYIFFKSDYLGLKFIYNNYIKNLKYENLDKTKFYKEILKKFKSQNYNKIFEVDKKIKVDKKVSTIKGLEIRKNQEKMLDIIDKSLIENKKVLIEAPTGLGKTFAYLIPSIIYSINSGEQVIISTTTKTLQDQILNKDLEFLKNNLGIDFSYTKLKGKNNYISIFQFFNFLEIREILSLKEVSFLLKIIFWIFRTKDFELDELDYIGDEFIYLKEINAENSLVLSKKNPYYKREPLVFYRTNAKKSNIVVVNNFLLFKDIDSENIIFGKIKNLVLDEAHNLEEVVTDSLRKGFFKKDLEKNIKILLNILNKNKCEDFVKIEKLTEDLLFNITFIFDIFSDYFYLNIKNNNEEGVLIRQDFYNISKEDLDLSKLTKNIKNNLVSILDFLRFLPDKLYLEVNNYISYLEEILDIVDKILDNNRQDLIKIIKITKYKQIGLEYSLLNIGDFLQKNLWEKIDTCILTSATFTINKNFSYFENLFNLKKFEKFILESDFNYKKQALIYFPDNLGYIKNNIGDIIDFLKQLILITKGQTLILFRALSTIKEVYLGIYKELKNNNINILAQGIGDSKTRLLKIYKQEYKNSVIMGSDTFWEGIDFTGEKLKYLVIHKIPFIPPNDPIFQARTILFNDSFRDYSIPKAIIKLKQGFGRLIRTKTDTGILIFLDNRVFSSSWGTLFLEAFPEGITIKKGTKENLLNVLNKV